MAVEAEIKRGADETAGYKKAHPAVTHWFFICLTHTHGYHIPIPIHPMILHSTLRLCFNCSGMGSSIIHGDSWSQSRDKYSG